MISSSRTSGPLIPTVAFDTGPGNWTTPNNAKVEDGNTAYDGNIGPGGGAHGDTALLLTGFGFSLPAAAAIDGIKLEAKVSGTGGMHDSQIYIKSNLQQSVSAPNFGQFWGSSLNWLTWGGPTSLWGRTWTPAEINNAAFGAGLAGFPNTGSQTSYIDAVRITVYWHYSSDVPASDVGQRYDYKIYDPAGKFIGNLPGVTRPFTTTQALNSTGAQLTIEAAGTPDGQKPNIALGRLNRWLSPNFKYRHRLTIPQASITGSISSMPVLINMADLPASFWQAVDTTGKDIRITDQYGVQELPYEIVAMDTSTRTGQLWFKAYNLSNAFDSGFYIYFGNSSAAAYAATDPYGRNNVWSDYASVYHLEEAANTTAGGYANAVGGTNGTGASMSNSAVAGKIGSKAASFDGVDDAVNAATTYGLGTSSVVLSAWVYISSYSMNGSFIKVGDSNGYGIGVGNTTFGDSGSQLIMLYEAQRWITTGQYFYSTGWHLVHMVIDASGNPLAYLDGNLVGTFTGTGAIAPTANSHVGGYISGRFFGGNIDEARVGGTVLSAARIKAEYTNQNNPSLFYKVTVRRETQTTDDASGVLLRDGNLVNVYETSYWHPNGLLKFQGQINRIEGSFAPEINGIVKAICHSDGRDLDNYPARGIPFTFTLDQQQTSQNNRVSNITQSYGGWDRWGQTWTANATSLGRIQLLLDGTANVTVNVYSSPGQGGGTLGSVSQYVSVGGPTVVDFNFPDLIKTVVGTSYFFEVLVDSGQSIWMQYSSSNPYSGGQMYESNYGGGSGGGGYYPSTGNDLYFTTSSGVPGTLANYTASDPTAGMLTSVMNDYISQSGNITYTPGTDIDATGLSLNAGFNTNTVYEVLDKVLSFSPNGFYYYVDLGTNKLRFKRVGTTADYLLIKGRHINELDLVFSIENVINTELVSGGLVSPGVNLYAKYVEPVSKGYYGQRLSRKSDNRVVAQATADAIGTSDLAQFRDEQYYTTVTIMAKTMNTTDIKLGQLVGVRGYGNYLDTMLLQITKIDYSPEMAVLQLGTLPLRFNRGFEDVIRGLVAEQTVSNPSTPS